jgi:hypothetical protein
MAGQMRSLSVLVTAGALAFTVFDVGDAQARPLPSARAGCVPVSTLTCSAAQGDAARRYWTTARVDAAKSYNSSALGALAGHAASTTATDLAFSPMWHNGQSPLGVWSAQKVFLNSGWMHCPVPVLDCGTNPLDDYAIIVLSPQNGKGIGTITGADGWSLLADAVTYEG